MNAVSWNGVGNLVNGSTSVDEAIGDKLNHGCVVGPVANRIAGASFEIDGTTYRFAPNEGVDTLLHSGTKSLRDRDWSVASRSDSDVTLFAEVANGEDGFPGSRRFGARYTVDDSGFGLTLTAETDAPTLVNLALHPYWTLDQSGRNGLRLEIAADEYLPVDGNLIPTGEIAPVEGTVFDLRSLSVPDTSIDYNYCLRTADGLIAAATLVSDKVTLDIETDAPGLQVFTGQKFGIALEPQHWPDAPNHAHFPSVRLDPGERYTQKSRYRFREA
mgnify:CR=1 FL=1